MMKKRILSLLLCLSLLLGTAVGSAQAAANADTRLEVVRVLGIMVGDTKGNLNLDKPVTRAEFVKMTVAASPYKDSVTSGSGAAQFSDVKTGHWAGGYIGVAVENGWIMGYVDGTFRPQRNITLEEGCTALLRVLGYDASTLAGAYPTAQLTKAQAVGLRDDLNAEKGRILTRRDCVTLFYNLLLCKTGGGQIYGTTLGYTVKNGEIDYSALISADTKGPYVAENGTLELPFGTENITIYRGGRQVTAQAVNANDVYYYHRNLRTVWVYNDRVSGTLTAVAPNRVTPASVTVGGQSYNLGTTSAVYQVSNQGGFRDGDMVTLILGMDGSVVKVLPASENAQAYYGVVLSSQKQSASETTGGSVLQVETKIVCTDGTERTFYHGGDEYDVGALVSAVVNQNGTAVSSLKTQKLSGTVDAQGKSLGGYTLAENVEILDTDGNGGYVKIYPQRLASAVLAEKDVLHYTLNDAGEIRSLILLRATGDTWDYGFVTEYTSRSGAQSVSSQYTYIMDGKSSRMSVSAVFPVQKGGVMIQYKDGAVERMYQLAKTQLNYLTEQSASDGIRSLKIAENVQAVICETEPTLTYYAADISQLNTQEYTLEGWYDNENYPAGGRLRIIVATPK